MMKAYPTLTTDRLILRKFEETDASIVKMLAGDYEIAKMTLNIPHPYEIQMAESWIATHQQEYDDDMGVVFAMVNPEYDDLVGAIGLTITQRFNRAELGYWVGKAHWGRGYATEASLEILKYAFEELKINKITATHMTRNPASGRVIKKIGMEYEGLLRQHALKWDQFLDIAAYGILAETWRQNHGE